MPFKGVLHITHPFTLYGITDDNRRFIFCVLELLKSTYNAFEIMTINSYDIPAKGTELLVNGGHRHDLVVVTINLPQLAYLCATEEEFWEKLTGDEDFYIHIIGYMGTLPEQYVEEYKSSYNKAANRLVREFSINFCNEDGSINWEKLVEFNSGK